MNAPGHQSPASEGTNSNVSIQSASSNRSHINLNAAQTSWSSIHYYEFNERLGNAFNVNQGKVQIY
jgi:hypothetical protein